MEGSETYLPHQPKIIVHFWLEGLDLCEDRVFEAPQNLVDSAGHEHLNAHAVQVHGNYSSQEEGVGVQLVHDGLKKRKQSGKISPVSACYMSFVLCGKSHELMLYLGSLGLK